MQVIAVSKYYQLYQDMSTRDFYLEVPGDYFRMEFCQLLSFRHNLNQIDILEHFESHSSNIEMVSFCDKKQFLLLNTLQILDLQNLLNQVFIAPQKTKKILVA